MNKFINSSKFCDELVFISNLGARGPLPARGGGGGADALPALAAAGQQHRRLLRRAAAEDAAGPFEATLPMRNSSSLWSLERCKGVKILSTSKNAEK